MAFNLVFTLLCLTSESAVSNNSNRSKDDKTYVLTLFLENSFTYDKSAHQSENKTFQPNLSQNKFLLFVSTEVLLL